MNLKLVVASMSVLGLIASPAFAGHGKHKRSKHRKAAMHRDYKDMGMNKCSIAPTTVMMVEMNQNVGRSLPNPCRPGWYDRIRLSGGMNVDMGKWGNTNANYMGENYARLSLNDVYLNLAANINSWTNVFASLSYMTASTNANPGAFNSRGLAEYSAAYANNINGTANNTVQIEQAFGTFGNFDVTPLYLQVGKSFQDFSRYEIHPITRSMTQVMSETLATSIKLGFIYNGFTGGVYAFNDPVNKIGGNASNNPYNYGAALGYDHNDSSLGYDLGVAYMYNMIAANDVAYMVQNYTNGMGYNRRVGGLAVYGDVNSGPFTLSARWTQALENFSVNDLTAKGFADLTAGSAVIGGGVAAVTPAGTAKGAKPWALGVRAGYDFNYWHKDQNVYVGYQKSSDAAGLNLPSYRWLLGYNVDVMKDTALGVQWDHDGAYSRSEGGRGSNSNLVSIRASVKFS